MFTERTLTTKQTMIQIENTDKRANYLQTEIETFRNLNLELENQKKKIHNLSPIEIFATFPQDIRPKVISWLHPKQSNRTDYFLIPKNFEEFAFAISIDNSRSSDRSVEVEFDGYKFEFRLQIISSNHMNRFGLDFSWHTDGDRDLEVTRELANMGVKTIFAAKQQNPKEHRIGQFQIDPEIFPKKLLNIVYVDRWEKMILEEHGNRKVQQFISSWLKVKEIAYEEKPSVPTHTSTYDPPDPWWVQNAERHREREMWEPSDGDG